VAEARSQRSIPTKLSVLAVTGLSLVIGGVFALGPVTWLGVTMIALGFWPAMLVPVLLLWGARRKLRPSASPFPAVPSPTADPANETSKVSWRKILLPASAIPGVSGALAIGIARGYSTWALLASAVVLAWILLIFAAAVTSVMLSRRSPDITDAALTCDGPNG
jgi:hypothetical protein